MNRRRRFTLALNLPLLALVAVLVAVAVVASARSSTRSWETVRVTALAQCEASTGPSRYLCRARGIRSNGLNGCTGTLDPHNGLPLCWTSCGFHLHDGARAAIANPALGLRCRQVVRVRYCTNRCWEIPLTVVGVTGSTFGLELTYRASRLLGASRGDWDAPRTMSLRR